MSGIQLSPALIENLRSVLVQHDAAADNDLLLLQYLSAVSGFILAHQLQPGLDKREFLSDLHAFANQVLDQVEEDMRPQPPQEGAFGIWKPE